MPWIALIYESKVLSDTNIDNYEKQHIPQPMPQLRMEQLTLQYPLREMSCDFAKERQ